MPDPVDTLIHHVGGLIAAAMNARVTDSCSAVYEHEPFEGAPNPSFPCLSIWRESEGAPKRLGTGALCVVPVTIKALYELGPRQVTKITASTATVTAAVKDARYALEDERAATYESGTGLYDLAGVTAIGLAGTRYLGGKEHYPCVEMTIECDAEDSRPISGGTTITDILGELDTNVDLDGIAIEYATGKHVVLTPLVHGVTAVTASGAALAVAASGKTVTLTLVGGTTTLAALIAKLATVPAAAELLAITGDAGTFPVGFPEVTLALSLPRTRQISETT